MPLTDSLAGGIREPRSRPPLRPRHVTACHSWHLPPGLLGSPLPDKRLPGGARERAQNLAHPQATPQPALSQGAVAAPALRSAGQAPRRCGSARARGVPPGRGSRGAPRQGSRPAPAGDQQGQRVSFPATGGRGADWGPCGLSTSLWGSAAHRRPQGGSQVSAPVPRLRFLSREVVTVTSAAVSGVLSVPPPPRPAPATFGLLYPPFRSQPRSCWFSFHPGGHLANSHLTPGPKSAPRPPPPDSRTHAR